MKIEVLGSGCAKCQKTAKVISETIRKIGVDAEVVHVTDLDEIISRGVMITPAVAIDGRVVLSGTVPSEAQIRSWFGK